MITTIISLFIFILIAFVGIDTVQAAKNFNSSKSNTHQASIKIDDGIGNTLRGYRIKESDVERVVNEISRGITIQDLKPMLWQIGLTQDGIVLVLSKLVDTEPGLKVLYQAYVGKVNQEVGDILLAYSIGGAEINKVADAVVAGIVEVDLKALLAEVGINQEKTEEVFVKIDAFETKFDSPEVEFTTATTGGAASPSDATDVTQGIEKVDVRRGTGEVSAPTAGDILTPTVESTVRLNSIERRDLTIKAVSTPDEEEPAQERGAVTPIDNDKISGEASPVSVRAVEVRGWDPMKKEEFLKTVKTHAEIQSKKDLENFAQGVLLKNENITDIEIKYDGPDVQSVKMGYRAPAKFLGIFKTSLKTSVEVNARNEVNVTFPWFRFLFSKQVGAEDIKEAAQNALDEDMQASQTLETLSSALEERFK